MSEPVIDLLETEWRAIADLCAELEEVDWDRPTECPGWTVRDNLSHIVGTERMLLGDQPPELPEGDYPHVRDAIGEFNERWVEASRARPGPEILAEFRDVTARRLDMLRAMTTEDFDQVGFTPIGEGPYRLFMQIRVFDCWTHEQDMRSATGRSGHLEGPIAEHSVRWLTRGMPMVVGKRAAAEEGASVVFAIDGPAGVVLPVVVDGRAAAVDEVPADPTVTIHLDVQAFTRLASGRWSASRVLEEERVGFDGDEELGRRVIGAMTVVP